MIKSLLDIARGVILNWYRYIILTLFTEACFLVSVSQSQYSSPINSVYQYSVSVGDRQAYLWLPPDCKHVRGVIISLSNLLERRWLEDPEIRRTASQEGLGIIWVGPGRNAALNADMKAGAAEALVKMLNDFAEESGYSELGVAPIIAMGHSANGQFSWNVANWNADRTIAVIPVKTIPFPSSLGFKEIPVCYLVGQTTEWPQYRVPDPAIMPGDRDFFWPVVKATAIKLRTESENNLVGVVVDPGGGHFDWNENQAKFISLYIKKACEYRLPKHVAGTGPVKLKKILKDKGWLIDTGGMDSDVYKPAPYRQYRGDPKKAFWFFDRETAQAAVAFQGDRKKREKQMLTFVQNGQQLPVAKQGFAPLKFIPLSDGLTFSVEGAFLSELPPELIGAGKQLGHASGPITFKVITGPAVQTGPNTFRIQFDRGGAGGDLWLQEEHPGDSEYRHAVQPGLMKVPAKLTEGRVQAINFPKIGDQKAGRDSIKLMAVSDSGLPVDYYVVAGPAVIEGNILKFTPIPLKTKYPVKITVVAYQWGRSIPPLLQTAQPVSQSFFVYK